jgi:TRAP-type C4-dicarboxylate transport system permease small subunit
MLFAALRRLRAAIDRAVAGALALLLAAAVANVLWQVFSRYVLMRPSAFTDELARYLLVWLGLLGAAYAFGQHRHLAVDLWPARWTQAEGLMARLLRAMPDLATLVFAIAVLLRGGAYLTSLSRDLGQHSAALELPLAWLYGVLPLAGALVAFYAAHSLLCGLTQEAETE